jgi:hypothetical protein
MKLQRFKEMQFSYLRRDLKITHYKICHIFHSTIHSFTLEWAPLIQYGLYVLIEYNSIENMQRQWSQDELWASLPSTWRYTKLDSSALIKHMPKSSASCPNAVQRNAWSNEYQAFSYLYWKVKSRQRESNVVIFTIRVLTKFFRIA